MINTKSIDDWIFHFRFTAVFNIRNGQWRQDEKKRG